MRGALKRALKLFHCCGSADDAEADLDRLLSKVIDDYVPWKTPTTPGLAPWWNCKCEKAYRWKLKCFVNRVKDPSRFHSAVKFNRKIQKEAYGSYQKKIKKKLASMSSSDGNFWQLAKEIGGLEPTRSDSAPSAQKLAEHFAEKMSNGKDDIPDEYIPKDGLKIPLLSFRIRYKTVLKALQNADPSKSTNGIAPIFWKECAKVVAPSVCKLFKHIVKHRKYVTRWKHGRVSAPHKRGSVKLPKNYRPLKVLMNISVIFEKTIHPQLYAWIAKSIPDTQFGFLKGVGSREYGCTLMFKMLSVLERRGEGILISLDVKGAFDRVWWAFLKVKLEARGMQGRALALMKNSLYRRFLQVVCQGDISELLEIFSGVPQGAVWSPSFWDFDIAVAP